MLKLSKFVHADPVYEIVVLAEKYGHKVLLTPPYHSEYNPIELIWGICKRYYDSHIDEVAVRFPDLKRKEQVIALWKEALSTVTPKVWSDTVKKVEARILEDHANQVGKFGDIAEPRPFIIALRDSDGEEDSDIDDPGVPSHGKVLCIDLGNSSQ